jgi:flagellar hook assembly protein FlgD
VDSTGEVLLEVYTLTGRRVATLVNGSIGAGSHQVTWDGKDSSGRDVASGVYYYRVYAEEGSQAGKMILLR